MLTINPTSTFKPVYQAQKLKPHNQTLSQNDTQALRFGMFKRKIEKATQRRDKILINPKATDRDKRRAQDFLEETKEASIEPEKYFKKVQAVVKGVQFLTSGAIAAALAAAGIPVDPETTDKTLEVALAGVAGGAIATGVNEYTKDPLASAITDKKYKESHYPSIDSRKSDNIYGCISHRGYAIGSDPDQYKWYGWTPNYFDEDGDRWEPDMKGVKELEKICDKWSDAWYDSHRANPKGLLLENLKKTHGENSEQVKKYIDAREKMDKLWEERDNKLKELPGKFTYRGVS